MSRPRNTSGGRSALRRRAHTVSRGRWWVGVACVLLVTVAFAVPLTSPRVGTHQPVLVTGSAQVRSCLTATRCTPVGVRGAISAVGRNGSVLATWATDLHGHFAFRVPATSMRLLFVPLDQGLTCAAPPDGVVASPRPLTISCSRTPSRYGPGQTAPARTTPKE